MLDTSGQACNFTRAVGVNVRAGRRGGLLASKSPAPCSQRIGCMGGFAPLVFRRPGVRRAAEDATDRTGIVASLDRVARAGRRATHRRDNADSSLRVPPFF